MLVGGAAEVSPDLSGIRDIVLAVGPGGDYAVAWENLGTPVRVRALGVQADVPAGDFPVSGAAGTEDAPAIALGAGGELVVAFLQTDNGLTHVHLRRFPSFVDGNAPDALQISEHPAGSPSSPTVAMHADGSAF